ncbi:MAG: cysteine desulfurase [Rhodospirillaceae bacterium]|nr:cysteine desulfurase [Rhodospirillaceae bacterium]
MSGSGKSLESQFMDMANGLAKEAGAMMAPEEYGQWAEESYRLMGMADGDGKSSMDGAMKMMNAGDVSAMNPSSINFSPKTLSDGVAMTAPALKSAGQLIPMMENVYGASEKAMTDGLYFMAESSKALLPATPAVENPGDPVSATSGIQGFDVLDPEFLCKMANDMYKSGAEYMAQMTKMAEQALGEAGPWMGQSGNATPHIPPITNQSSVGALMPNLDNMPYFMSGAGAASRTASGASAFNIEGVRSDFPILHRTVHGKPLIWLDNGATTQKPQVVIDRVSHFYEYENSNVHRGAHTMAAESTDAYEGARAKIATFMGASLPEEVIFVRGTTEGMNLIANTVGDKFLKAGDEIILTEAEHHANIVPWQFISHRTGAKIRVAPIDNNGEIIIEEYARLLSPRTRIVSITHVSNALGTVMPIAEMTAMAKRYGAIVVIDGAQGIPHRVVNVGAIGCDFYVFSGHKLYGPTGIGVVWGRKDLWEEVSPWQGGGSMIEKVTFEKSTFAGLPNKFEAGTGSLASAIGLGAAIDYVSSLGIEAIERHEAMVVDYAVQEIQKINGVRMIGMPKDRAGVVSFVMDGIPVREVGTLLDAEGIAVRAGHHCAQPALAHFGLEATVRPAFSIYNTMGEVDALVAALRKISFSAKC